MTDQSSDNIWNDCKLGRETDAMIIEKFIDNTLAQKEMAGKTQSLVLNLDAPWGGGKTFFLSLFKQHLERSGNVVAYVDAWQDDHSDDPFLTVVDEITTALTKHLPAAQRDKKARSFLSATRSVAGTMLLHTGKHWMSKAISREAVEAFGDAFSTEEGDSSDLNEANEDKGKKVDKSDEVKNAEAAMEAGLKRAADEAGGAILKAFKISKSVRRSFQEKLDELVKQVKGEGRTKAPVYVIIDELDRCRPDYAIELLESVKHLFSVDGIVFVLATDSQQLVQAVKGVFGSEIDGSRYLERFVDRTYKFQETSMSDFISVTAKSLGMNVGNYADLDGMEATEFWAHILNEASISLRAAERILGIMSTFEAAWPYSNSKISPVVLLTEAANLCFSQPEFEKVCGATMHFRKLGQQNLRVQGSDTVEINLRNMTAILNSGYERADKVGGGDSFRIAAHSFLATSHHDRMQETPYGFPTSKISISDQYRQILSRVVKSFD